MVDKISVVTGPINPKSPTILNFGPLPNVNLALFVTAFETLSVYMRLTRKSMAFSGNFGKFRPLAIFP